MSKKKKKLDAEAEVAEVNETIENEANEEAATEASVSVEAPKSGVYIDKEEQAAFLESIRKRKKRKRIITTVIVIVVVLVAAFIVYKVAFGDNKNAIDFSDDYLTKSQPKTAIQNYAADGTAAIEFAKVTNSEGSDVSLSYIPAVDLITVNVTNKDGVTSSFRSWPEPTADDGFTTVGVTTVFAENFDIISSPVLVGYTKSGIEGGNTFAVNQMQHVKTVNSIDGGLQLKYDLLDLSCSFYIEFTLDSDGALVVTVPVYGITEPAPGEGETADRMPRIASITALPYMGATRQGDSGYFVTPDGSGSLTYFDVSRISSNDEYSKRIYGYDYTFDSFSSPDYSNENISLPVYGVINNTEGRGKNIHTMISSFATLGEASTSVVMGTPGMKNLDFYYIAYKFNIREFYYNSISKSGDTYKFLEEVLGVGDMQAKYYFDVSETAVDLDAEENDITEGSFTYVDLAVKTREFLKTKWGIDKTVDTSANSDLVNLKVLLGAENTSSVSLLSEVKVMTTFSDVKDIYNELNTAGASDVRLSLLGWQNDGYYGNITKKYNVESDFGGESGLEDLTEWAATNGVTVSADNNLLKLYSAPKAGVSLRNAVVKEPGTSYLSFRVSNASGVYRRGTDFYYMSPLYYNKKVLSKDIEEISELGFDNIDLQQVGDLLYTDYNKKNALLRQQGLNYYQSWIQSYQNSFNQVSVYYGFDYAVKDADLLLDIPNESSALFVLDETVPFMQIVYHGLVDYYCTPLNREDHPDDALLKAIEYGCLFSFEITEENTEELKYTFYNDLFKSEFDLLKQDIVDAYTIAQNTMSELRTATITDHYCVDEERSGDVYCTEYSNGSKVYVNYGDTDYTIEDGKVVASNDILLDK